MRLYSAVVDSYGYDDFPFQATQLVWSLTEICGVSKSNIILHHVDEMPERTKRLLEPLGVEIDIIERFPGHPWCNKLNQFNSLKKRNFDEIIMLDCDCIVLDLPPSFKGVMSKPVDFGLHTPIEAIIKICEDVGINNYKFTISDVDGTSAIKGYCNGGVYVIDKCIFDTLTTEWLKWAKWLFKEKYDILQKYNCFCFVDQISFIFSIYLNNIPYKELDRKFNCPPFPSKDCIPSIIHYHDRYDENYYILPTGRTPLMDSKIMEVNQMIKQHRKMSGIDQFYIPVNHDPYNSYHSHMWDPFNDHRPAVKIENI